MSANLNNEKFKGMPEWWLLKQIGLLKEEIAKNLEENITMQAEIEAIWEEIGRQANPR